MHDGEIRPPGEDRTEPKGSSVHTSLTAQSDPFVLLAAIGAELPGA
jgi:hypothetical protein